MHISLSRIRLGTLAFGATLIMACGSATPPAGSPPPSAPAPSSEATAPEAPPAVPSPPPADVREAVHLARESALEGMKPAIRSTKMTVPVDLSYRFSADPVTGQPTELHLAAIPRVGGSNLTVSIKNEPGVRVEVAPGAANIQKASAAAVYRKQMAVTRTDVRATRVRVLVTMDFASGSGFGFFTIPLEGAPDAPPPVQKKDSVKQH